VVETISSNVTELRYGQEELGYPTLLILIECCIVNIFVAGICLTTAERVHLNRVTVDQFLLCSIDMVKINMYQISIFVIFL
jgi:hypothetical protein